MTRRAPASFGIAGLAALVLLSGCAGWVEKKPASVAAKQKPEAVAVAKPAQAAEPAEKKETAQTAGKTSGPRRVMKLVTPQRPPGAVCLSCRAPAEVLVNKQSPIAAWDVPEDLVEAEIPFLGDVGHPRRFLRAAAARAAERMFAAAQAAGHRLYGISGFRSFETQQQVFNYNVRDYGSVQKANLVSARAGQSEHQTGLALDLTSAAAGYRLDKSFGDSPEANWLRANAARYGFILRYPQGKESVTGYNYEPWHWRYVGRAVAETIARSGLTLEEYRDENGRSPPSRTASSAEAEINTTASAVATHKVTNRRTP